MANDAALHAVDGAVKAQGYRPIVTEVLTEAGAIDITTGFIPDDLAAVLQGVTRDPAWQLIGQQLSLLRTRGGSAFQRIYLGVKKGHLCLAVIYVYPDAVLSTGTWRSDFDWCWDILRFLEDAVGRYKISAEWAGAAHRAVDRYGDAGGAASVSAGLSLLASAIELSEVARGPCGSFVGVAPAGIDPDLGRRLNRAEFSRTKGFWSNVPCLAGYAWHPGSGTVHGSAAFQTLERLSLERSLRRELPPGRPRLVSVFSLVDKQPRGTPQELPPATQAPPPPSPPSSISASKPAALTSSAAAPQGVEAPPVAPTEPDPARPAASPGPQPVHADEEPRPRPRVMMSLDDAVKYTVAELDRQDSQAPETAVPFNAFVERTIRSQAVAAVAHSPARLRRLRELFVRRDALIATGRTPPQRDSAEELLKDI